jgi:trimeric autotransporter adhesin
LLILAPALCLAQAPPAYTITTVAGQLGQQGNYAGDGGPALNAFLFGPSDVILDSSGNIYFSDTVNNRIREVVPNTGAVDTWLINTVAGDGTAGYNGDGTLATAAGTELSSPTGITFDSSGNLYIADTGNFVIREVVASSGNISTVAGENSLGAGFSGDDGPAPTAQLNNPSGVAVDPTGNMYIADPANNVVRVVCANQTPIACTHLGYGDINTFAGNDTQGANYSGDGGPPTSALLNDPVAVVLDPAGNLYISDSGNNVIRKVTPGQNAVISTVAGTAANPPGFSGDGGPAIKAQLNGPKGLAADSSGNLYIADHDNSVIRMVNASGTIYTIAGNQGAGPGDFGDGGPATSAQLTFPSGVAAYGGKIYIADNSNNAIRLLTPPAQVPQIGAGGVVNDASYTAPVAPGSIAAVFGDFFLTSGSSDTEVPLSTSLQNLSFLFSGGTAAPLYYVSSGQANIQVPWELAGQTSATLTATLNGTAGAAQTVAVADFAPAIFTLNAQGNGPGAILDSSYRLVNSANPVTAGSTTILIYCTGLGAVSANQPGTGVPASTTELAPTVTLPTVTIGGITANVSFSGLAPGFVGLYQVNALVPAGVASGPTVPVSISIQGVTSNTVSIVVQ